MLLLRLVAAGLLEFCLRTTDPVVGRCIWALSLLDSTAPCLHASPTGRGAGLQISADTSLSVAGPLEFATSFDVPCHLGSWLLADPLDRLYKAGMDRACPQLQGLQDSKPLA